MPIGLISNIHYTRLTDLAWSSDGRILIVSSTDGFCTMITFAVDELGTTYQAVGDADQQSITDVDNLNQSICISSDDDGNEDEEAASTEKKPVDGDDKVEANHSNVAPTQIAFRRKPRETIVDVVNSTEKLASLQITESVDPIPIGIRKKALSKKMANNESIPPDVNAISIRRKPKTPGIVKPKEQVPEPNPIAFQRKPKIPRPTDKSPKRKSPSSDAINPAQVPVHEIPAKVPALEIPNVIISTNDKFESPGNHNRPATPIQIRRAPRNPTPNGTTLKPVTPEVCRFKGQFPGDDDDEQTTPKSSKTVEPLSTTKKLKTPASVTKNTTKKATPIAVRRHQRNILPSVHTVERSATEDEALDAWPIDQPRPTTLRSTSIPTGLEIVAPPLIAPVVNENIAPLAACGAAVMDVDNTEDIRLVYEDESQKETSAQVIDTFLSPMKDNAKMCTPDSKTPRRVELRTISTPKSKKKLL